MGCIYMCAISSLTPFLCEVRGHEVPVWGSHSMFILLDSTSHEADPLTNVVSLFSVMRSSGSGSEQRLNK